ncbi:hypothetical protein FSARC_8428 [Fusarium sarcochroum]|uniref:Uncharacterized protein n=1 Tax=Fusarium sarcochroum TaxID=1208366 RepID=A0A8H4X6C3_9HYPO|nr:hypothetical protein FSARC_8428 [Fusarium sarcochroum]
MDQNPNFQPVNYMTVQGDIMQDLLSRLQTLEPLPQPESEYPSEAQSPATEWNEVGDKMTPSLFFITSQNPSCPITIYSCLHGDSTYRLQVLRGYRSDRDSSPTGLIPTIIFPSMGSAKKSACTIWLSESQTCESYTRKTTQAVAAMERYRHGALPPWSVTSTLWPLLGKVRPILYCSSRYHDFHRALKAADAQKMERRHEFGSLDLHKAHRCKEKTCSPVTGHIFQTRSMLGIKYYDYDNLSDCLSTFWQSSVSTFIRSPTFYATSRRGSVDAKTQIGVPHLIFNTLALWRILVSPKEKELFQHFRDVWKRAVHDMVNFINNVFKMIGARETFHVEILVSKLYVDGNLYPILGQPKLLTACKDIKTWSMKS